MNDDVPSTTPTGQAKTGSSPATAAERAVAMLLVGLGLAGLADLAAMLAWGRNDAAVGKDSARSIDVLLLLAFGLQHSGMARECWTRWLSPRWERAIYVAASGVVSILLARGWHPLPGAEWWAVSQPWNVVLLVLRGTASIGMALCTLRMDLADFLGLRAFWPMVEGGADVLDVSGPYRFVRHPLMAFFLLFLWARPEMSATDGWLAAGLTAYVLLGICLEERSLRRQFGDAYDAYRRCTPMLIPWFVREPSTK
ncbi:MAG: isoprenylcysteine carboxylmethyltransferase family protein [Gemmataceae bacterium]